MENNIQKQIKDYVKTLKNNNYRLFPNQKLYKEGIRILEEVSNVYPPSIKCYGNYIFNNISGIRYVDDIVPLPTEIKEYLNNAMRKDN